MKLPQSPAEMPTKEDLLREYGYRDPLVYETIKLQSRFDLTDDQMYCLLIMLLLDRHQHIDRAYKNLLAQTPRSSIIDIASS